MFATHPRLTRSALRPVEVVVEDIGRNATCPHGVFDQKIVLVPVAISPVPQVVSSISVGTLRLDPHAKSHVSGVKPPLPVRAVRALLVTREWTDRHPVSMGLVDSPEVLLGVSHFTRRPAPTVFGSQRLKGQLGTSAKSSAQRADHGRTCATEATKGVIFIDLLTTSATRQLAFTSQRSACPASHPQDIDESDSMHPKPRRCPRQRARPVH
jgi:hypothetical protein